MNQMPATAALNSISMKMACIPNGLVKAIEAKRQNIFFQVQTFRQFGESIWVFDFARCCLQGGRLRAAGRTAMRLTIETYVTAAIATGRRTF